MAEDVTNRGHENYQHHRAHSRRQPGVHSRRGLDPAKVQECKPHRKNNFPAPVRDRRSKFMRLSRAPDHANQWIHNVIHHHAPTRHIPNRRVDLLSHIRERRSRARIRPRHAPVTDGRKKHSHHGNQNCRNYVAPAAIAQRSERGHRRNRLQHDHPVQNQIPQCKRPPQPGRRRGYRRRFRAQALVLSTQHRLSRALLNRFKRRHSVGIPSARQAQNFRPASFFSSPCDTGPPPCSVSPNSANPSPPPPKRTRRSAWWPIISELLRSKSPLSPLSTCVAASSPAVKNASSPLASRFSFARSPRSQIKIPRTSLQSFVITVILAPAPRKFCAIISRGLRSPLRKSQESMPPSRNSAALPKSKPFSSTPSNASLPPKPNISSKSPPA